MARFNGRIHCNSPKFPSTPFCGKLQHSFIGHNQFTINSKWTYQRWLCLPNVIQCAESHHADRFTRLSCPYDDPNTLLSRPQDRTEMSPERFR